MLGLGWYWPWGHAVHVVLSDANSPLGQTTAHQTNQALSIIDSHKIYPLEIDTAHIEQLEQTTEHQIAEAFLIHTDFIHLK